MQLKRMMEHFYLKVFIGIALTHAYTEISVVLMRGKSVHKQLKRKFEGTEPTEEMLEFIRDASEQSPLFYTALLCDVVEQGAIPTCSKQQVKRFLDVSDYEQLCHDNIWMTYVSKASLYQRLEMFKNIGLDFVFSPFSLLSLFYREKIEKEDALFILSDATSLALAVFVNGELRFAAYDKVERQTRPLLPVEDSEIDELHAIFMDLQEDDFDDTSVRFKSIEKRLQEYYHDERYASEFIEKIYLADSRISADGLTEMLEDQLFAAVELTKIDLAFETAKLASMEAEYAV